MIEKKYTIFVSSTYTDLIEERRIVIEAIVAAGHIPIAMEYFTAGNQEQFEFIKPLIDKSDYYILLVAGKYGSISEETNKSYTEMEYDYAIEKGVPVASFLLDDEAIKNRASKYVDREEQKIKLLAEFRKKVSAKKMCKFFSDQAELGFWINRTIDNLIKDCERPGWVRTSDIDLNEIKKKSSEEYLDIISKVTEKATNKAKAIQYFIQATQENDENRAIGLYTDCITQDPDFAEAYNNRGYLRYREGEIDDAKKDFKNAIAKKKNYSEAYYNLGVLLFSQKNFEDAEEIFNLAGEYAEAKLSLGLLKYANGMDEGTYFQKAIELKTNFAEAYYIRGLYYLDYWNLGDGIKDIIKAKDYKPNVIESFPYRNLLTGKMKEWDNSFNRVNYSRDFKTLISVPQDKEDIFKIPESVTVIGDYAFEDCYNLTSIVIPDSVTEIGESAFSVCTRLTSIVIPDSVTVIENGAFVGCSSLTSIVIPTGVTMIGEFAFKDCTDLTSIVIPDSVTLIGDGAFEKCASLREVHLKHTSPVDFSFAFEDLDLSKITLYVPKESVEAYKNDPFYKRFKVEPDKE